MKKTLALLLAAILLASSLASCNKKSEDDVTTVNETTSAEDTTTPYEELEAIGNYSDADVLTYQNDGESILLPLNFYSLLLNSSECAINSLTDAEDKITLSSSAVTPFGIKLGDTVEDIVSAFDIQPGYMAVGTAEYESLEKVDVGQGTGICLGFTRSDEGVWSFMDYQMIIDLIGCRAQMLTNMQMIMFSFIVDSEQNITQILELYGTFDYVSAALAPLE